MSSSRRRGNLLAVALVLAIVFFVLLPTLQEIKARRSILAMRSWLSKGDVDIILHDQTLAPGRAADSPFSDGTVPYDPDDTVPNDSEPARHDTEEYAATEVLDDIHEPFMYDEHEEQGDAVGWPEEEEEEENRPATFKLGGSSSLK
ncbi:hypothetical protein LIA77_00996 [Sarocladium implicatum]|nr:hypothetical protein LIA77_00996 [Sarocladium implicatum]